MGPEPKTAAELESVAGGELGVNLKIGDRVIVSGPPGDVVGEVMHIAAPDELPDLGPGTNSAEARAIIHEMGVDLVAAITHLHNDEPVMFCALHLSDESWRDLRGQPLRITRIRKE